MTETPHSKAANSPAAERSDKDRVLIFDTTLRDGEQSPGATMTHEEKLQVAEILDEMGVDIASTPLSVRPPCIGSISCR